MRQEVRLPRNCDGHSRLAVACRPTCQLAVSVYCVCCVADIPYVDEGSQAPLTGTLSKDSWKAQVGLASNLTGTCVMC